VPSVPSSAVRVATDRGVCWCTCRGGGWRRSNKTHTLRVAPMDELSRRVREKEEPQNGIKKEKKRTDDVQFDGTHHAVRSLWPLLQFKKKTWPAVTCMYIYCCPVLPSPL
jgi:hypothetical protein